MMDTIDVFHSQRRPALRRAGSMQHASESMAARTRAIATRASCAGPTVLAQQRAPL